MTKHVHIREISNNFYSATADLSEPIVVTKRGTPVMTISGTNSGASLSYTAAAAFTTPMSQEEVVVAKEEFSQVLQDKGFTEEFVEKVFQELQQKGVRRDEKNKKLHDHS